MLYKHWKARLKSMRLFKDKIVKNASWLIGGKIAQMALSLVVGMISARYLGPKNHGLLNYGIAFTNFFMSFCTLGINSIIIKNFIDYPEEEGKALGSAILYRIISSMCSIVLIIGISCILDYGSRESIIVVALCSVSLVFHAFDTINYWFQSKYLSKVTAIVSFLGYTAMALFKIGLLIFEKNIFWFAAAASIEYFVIAVLLVFAYKKNNGPKLCFSFEKGNTLLKKSYHYILSGMMVAIYAQTDKLMLKHMLDEVSVGYYAAASAICSMWTFVLMAIIDSFYPSLIQSFKTNINEFNKKNRQLYAIVFYLSVVASL